MRGDALLIDLRGRQQASRFDPASGEGAEQPVGRNPQHQQQQHREDQQAVFGKVRQQFRHQHNQQCTHQRPEQHPATADNHRQHKQNGLGEREGFRIDEHQQGCEQTARQSGQCRRQGKRQGFADDWIEAQ
ncbi:hypothetical protein D3C86_1699190 [compost metagenome]